MKKFEYKMLEIPARGFWGRRIDSQEVVEKLNEFGRQGWEVVSSFDTNAWRGGSWDIIVILKRELEN
jgi:hypothetical protein